MAMLREDNGTSNFMVLQRLARSFDDVDGRGRPRIPSRERTAFRIARTLGPAAVPLCARNLAADDDGRSRWASSLLRKIASDPDTATRVAVACRGVAENPTVSDASKLRAAALLDDLGIPAQNIALADPDQAQFSSLKHLAQRLTTCSEIAEAAAWALASLGPAELCELCADLATISAGAAARLCTELSLRHDVPPAALPNLLRLRAELLAVASPAPPQHSARRVRAHVGVRADGRRVVVCSESAKETAGEQRMLAVLVSTGGVLEDAFYRGDASAEENRREILAPLCAEGYGLMDTSRAFAFQVIADAAAAAHERGQPLPESYYLGRDLVGVYDEHLGDARRRAEARVPTHLLARATDLLAAGEPGRARPLLERFVATCPDDADGHATLGLCLLTLGDDGAEASFHRAATLEPENRLHAWNLAAAAHAAGRASACYRALCRYLSLPAENAETDADANVAAAREYVAEYERIARLAHPGETPETIARADDLATAARANL